MICLHMDCFEAMSQRGTKDVWLVIQTHVIAIQKNCAKLPTSITIGGCCQITHIEGIPMTSMTSLKEGQP